MEQVELLVGSEQRFFDFIRRLNEKDKIALISHSDLDGVASSKLASKIVDVKFMKFIDYFDINEGLVNELKTNGINKIIFTDISFEKGEIVKELEKFAEILIIDHHLFTLDLNSDKTVFISVDGYCASYLCYYLFSKIENLTMLDWLVAAASLSDFCYHKNAEWLEQVEKKYGERFSIQEMAKLSRIYDVSLKLSLTLIYFRGKVDETYKMLGDNIESAENLENYAKDVQREINESAERFEKEKNAFKSGEGYFWEFAPEFFIKSILINHLSIRHPDKTMILVQNNDSYYEISARRKDGKTNIVELLKNLGRGLDVSSGGHMFAAGATILPKYIPYFRERLRNL